MTYDDSAIDLLTRRVQHNIQNEEWDKLLEALPVAEEAKLPIELLEQGWLLIGDYLISRESHSEAIYAFNKARKHNPASVEVFDKLISAIDGFVNKNRSVFSKGDLSKLVPPLTAIIKFHADAFPEQKRIVELGNSIIAKIDYIKEYIAQSSEETKVSYQLELIVNSLDKEAPMSQVRQEIAKFIASVIRKKRTQNKTHNQQAIENKD